MRCLALLALAAALVPAATASAQPPDGFRESARLTIRAQKISGNPNATVYCARNAAAWVTFVRQWFDGRVSAVTVAEERASYFERPSCLPLEGWLRGRKVGRYEFAAAALSLVHEAMHLRGIVDEGEAECRAYRELPAWLRSQFGVRRKSTLRALMRHARAAHLQKPPAYRTVCY